MRYCGVVMEWAPVRDHFWPHLAPLALWHDSVWPLSGMALPAKIPASVSAMSFDLMGLLHPTPPAGVPRVSGISDKTRYGHLKFSTSKRWSSQLGT